MALARSKKLPVTHAGVIFSRRILKQHGMSLADAAKRLHMSHKQMSLFVSGKSDVSIALAKKLEMSTGVSAIFWLNIQKSYDLYV